MSERPMAGVAIWVLAGVLAVAALWRLTASGERPAGAPVRIDRGPDEPRDGRSRAAGGLFVHVAGAVRRPGLVRVPSGARVQAAVERAGGVSPRADLAGVNLAAQLEDGQQVIVPLRGGAAAGGAAAAGAASSALEPGAPGALKLSLAAATVDQLDELDGIGPTLAERIVEYRAEHGGFRSLDELREVEGIGEKRYASLSEAVQP